MNRFALTQAHARGLAEPFIPCNWAPRNQGQCAAIDQPNAYGTDISVDAARKVAIAAVAEAQKNGWTMAVAVTDTGGNLVYYEKMDNTQIGSSNVSAGEARSAVLYKRPIKAMQDALK